ncbi:MAG: DUF4468 domain-containing protein [Bacteroides sp.]|nr:DUF4468 domain-containing protein [Bacteroides sp.]
MKTSFKTLALLLGMAAFMPLNAQERDDSRYLEGAVPEVDGKVLFTKEFSIPGMSKEEIYDRSKEWLEMRMEQNENTSRIVYEQAEEGLMVGLGQEWVVFSSSALSLDRTMMSYQLTLDCQTEKCVMTLGKIRYNYRDGKEKYTAEEWIVDKYALNKAKTKLVRGLAKWRRKTVDFNDQLAKELATALSANRSDRQAQQTAAAQPATPAAQGEQVIVIRPQGEVLEVKPQAPAVTVSTPTVQPVPSTAQPVATPVVTQPAATTPANSYQEIAPEQLTPDLIQMGSGKLVIVIGTDAFNMTMMTANAGGSLGKMGGKSVVFVMLSPDQPYEQMDKAETYTVRFHPGGQEQPSLIMECKRQPSQTPLEGQPRMYIGEILKAKQLQK